MPLGLNDRQGDNWRLMLAIADLCRRRLAGAGARRGAALSKGDDDADARGIQALADIQQVFADRPTSARPSTSDAIVAAPDPRWKGGPGRTSPRASR